MSEPAMNALRALGAEEVLREQLVALCRSTERHFGLRRGDVREAITGPLIDAAHRRGVVLKKELMDGTIFYFAYRSKIARDFVLSPEPKPDHVWEPQTTRLLVHLARRSRQAVIGGGYIGDHAVFIARELGTGGTCHAFEPNAESAGLMRRNAAQNAVSNLFVHELGLWNRDRARLVLVGDDSHAHPEEAASHDGIQTITLESFAKEHGIAHVELLMLDIEGGEQAALEGAACFLRQPKTQAPAVVFEIHRSYVDWSHGLPSTTLVRMMMDAGYKVFAVRDFQSNVPMHACRIELIPADSVYLEGPPHGFNMLAIKDDALLDDPLFRICHDKSPKLLLYKDPQLHHPSEWLDRLPDWLAGKD